MDAQALGNGPNPREHEPPGAGVLLARPGGAERDPGAATAQRGRESGGLAPPAAGEPLRSGSAKRALQFAHTQE